MIWRSIRTRWTCSSGSIPSACCDRSMSCTSWGARSEDPRRVSIATSSKDMGDGDTRPTSSSSLSLPMQAPWRPKVTSRRSEDYTLIFKRRHPRSWMPTTNWVPGYSRSSSTSRSTGTTHPPMNKALLNKLDNSQPSETPLTDNRQLTTDTRTMLRFTRMSGQDRQPTTDNCPQCQNHGCPRING